MPTIAVIGGTGAQGGSVVNQLLKAGTWKIRALTRNANNDTAKALTTKACHLPPGRPTFRFLANKSQGVEVVSADVNDEASLVKAFEGVDAVFATTAYWPSVPTLGRDGAGEEETEQLIKIANAAEKTKSLEHFIISSLPPAGEVSGGKLKVPHFDYKQKAVSWIKKNKPELYGKTSQIWPGWYTSNLVALPMGKFWPIPYAGYIWAQPSKPTALLPIAGDLDYNFGVVVEGLLNAKEKAYGKHAVCITDYLPMTDVVKTFEEVTGKPAIYAEISDEAITHQFSIFGAEFASQLRWSEEYPKWDQLDPENNISLEQLGVKDKLVGFKAALKALGDKVL